MLDRFGCYLTGERALTVPVARAYCHWVRLFVEEVLRANDIGRLRGLTAGDVTRFLATRLPNMSRKSAQMTACALRSLLRFLHSEALVEVSLADAVPAIASWRLSGYPRALAPAEIEAIRAACDRSKPVGRRDLAVIGLLHRLGLRVAEAAALRLEDIDWLTGASPSAVRATVATGCRCPSTSAMRWSTTCAVAGPTHRRARCSFGPEHPTPRCTRPASAASLPAPRNAPGWEPFTATAFGTARPPTRSTRAQASTKSRS